MTSVRSTENPAKSTAARLALLVAVALVGLGLMASAASAVTPQLSLGSAFTCVLTGGGTVQCWGTNQYGSLGNNSNTASKTPVSVQGLTGVTQIAAGGDHACALLSDTTVKCWGQNIYGQLGDNSQTDRKVPVAVSGLTGVTQITAGWTNTCALLSDKTVKCWGESSMNGNGSYFDASTPVAVTGLTDVTQIALGGSSACALLSDKTLKCWGANDRFQLGDPTTSGVHRTPYAVPNISDAVEVKVGYKTACARLSDGTLKCLGYSQFGSLGNGDFGASLNPQYSQKTAVSVSGISTATQIDMHHGNHGCGLLADTSIKCWGYNGASQLGDGTTTNSASPLAVSGLTGVTQVATGGNHTCVIASGAVKCWGYNVSGQLGDGTNTTRSTPVDVSGLALAPPADPVLSGAPSAVTNQTSASIGFTSDAGATFLCSVDGGAFSACTSPKSIGSLGQGAHSLAVKAVKGGLESGITTASWTVDTTAPSAPTVTRTSPTSSPTQQTTATITYSGAEAGGTFTCSLDGGAYGACPSSPVPLTGLADGSHTYSVKQTDAAGNSSSAGSVSWVVDNTAPSAPSVSGPSLSSDITHITFSGAEAGGTLTCSLDGGAYGPCPSSPVTLTGLSDGSHTYSVKQTDAAGNTSNAGSFTWTADTALPAAPTVTLTSPTLSPTTQTTATITYSGEVGATYVCSLDGEPFTTCPSSPVALSGLADGPHNYRVRQTDTAGNSGPAGTVNWTVDTIAPAAPVIGGTPSAPSTATTQAFTITKERGTTAQCSLDGGPFVTCVSPVTYRGLAIGSHSLRVKVADGAGNVSPVTTASWSVIPVPPRIRCAPPTVTKPTYELVKVPALYSYVWAVRANGKPGNNDTRKDCALMTLQVSQSTTEPAADEPIKPFKISDGTFTYSSFVITKIGIAPPRWVRVENHVGQWSAWTQAKVNLKR